MTETVETNAAFEETVANQIRAASPSLSAFVSANAGSGKTRVLTTRVARLLLAGVAPSRLLCITFTKAAAAEMADRLFDLLGQWSLADDDALARALKDIGAPLEEITPPRADNAEKLARARRLFAKALETPGGLKIQTIHAFCETVLKRFPLEANVAPGFSVIEDADATRLQEDAVNALAAKLDGADNEDARALYVLARARSAVAVRTMILSALANEKRRSAFMAEDFVDRLAASLSVATDANPDAVVAELDNRINPAKVDALAGALLYGGKTALKLGEQLSAYKATSAAKERLALLQSVFFTQSGKPRAKISDKAARAAAPQAEAFEETLREAIAALIDELRATQIFQETTALARLTRSAAARYEKAKAARAGLDFDDLIQKTRALFEEPARAQWVMYKLDQGIDHILLDEAQDTSPDAWRVIEAPLDEFFAGGGAFEARTNEDQTNARTFFAVGDQKQSIYSFQGADAALFQAKAVDLGERISAAAPFANVPLQLSFRTSAPVLQFVDALFAEDAVLDGVSVDKPLTHGVFRTEAPGLVELWPLTPRPEKADLKPWDAPLNALTAESPQRQLAAAVAKQIKTWLHEGEHLAPGKPLRAGDIMILVQSRGVLFREMIKALAAAGVPAAGADRLTLMDDQAVKDLFSYARAVLFEEDDLSLAETLKSPFFNFTDDDLFDLAYSRQGTLRRALEARSKSDDEKARAYANICTALADAGRVAAFEGPFAFFTHLLETGAPSGRKRLLARLDEPARDPLNALLSLALDFEQSHPRSLTRFLEWAEARGADVNRDPENAGDVVRVMTVHKSKGLEAPVVFMLDAHRRRTRTEAFFDAAPPSDNSMQKGGAQRGAVLPVLAPASANDAPATADARKRAKRLDSEEYRRLLYVAATRARDRLYICGVEDGRAGDPHDKPLGEKSWHALAEDAFGRLAENGGAIETDIRWERTVRRFGFRASDTPAPKPTSPPKILLADEKPPAFLFEAAPSEQPLRRIQPSHLADKVETSASESTPVSPTGKAEALLRGNCLHRLLEISTMGADSEWRVRADRLLEALAPKIARTTRDDWREEAAAVLTDPSFADVFGPSARAEIAIGGRLDNGSVLSGQIDRLLIAPDRILIVDFKTNRPPPACVEDTPPAYLAQMGAYAFLMKRIYPDRPVKTALLWTFEARLTPLPEKLTETALKRTLA